MLKLVYICLAVAFTSFAILIFLAIDSGRYFHGTTSHMLETLQSDALVLDADQYGAIVQTGNGRVLGFKRGQREPVWEKRFERFGENLSWQNPPPDAQAWCTGHCPSAIVEIEGEFSARGGADKSIADRLGPRASVIGTTDDGVLAVTGGRTLLLRRNSSSELPTAGMPTAGYVDKDNRHVVTGTVHTDSRTFDRFVRSGEDFRDIVKPLTVPSLGNLCLSPDGEWTGAIGDRVQIGAFDAAELKKVGTPTVGGVCRADAEGFTAIVNPLERRALVHATRYSHDGRRIWTKLVGARRLISPGPSPLIIAIAPDGTITSLDSVTGEALQQIHLHSGAEPMVGPDGALVTAARNGTPTWHEFKRANGSTYELDR